MDGWLRGFGALLLLQPWHPDAGRRWHRKAASNDYPWCQREPNGYDTVFDHWRVLNEQHHHH
jgi:hypothetical protein